MSGNDRNISSWAFTIVEMLVATALATILMVAVMGLATSTGHMREAAQARSAQPDWADRLVDLIRRDLAHARWMDVGPDRLVLRGYGSLEGPQGTPCHQRTQTEYAVRNAGGRMYLVRQETLLDDLTNQNQFVSAACADVVEFTIQRDRPRTMPATAPAPHDVPEAVRMRVRFAPANDRPMEALERIIVIR